MPESFLDPSWYRVAALKPRLRPHVRLHRHEYRGQLCLGITQEQFAARFGVSVATLRYWERGDRGPQGPALVLLNVIQREPQAVLRALG